MKKEHLDRITKLRHELHRHPELSGCEKETVKRLQRFLAEWTDLIIVPRGGWFYAVKEGTDPEAGSLAFRADMDALPIPEIMPGGAAGQDTEQELPNGEAGQAAAQHEPKAGCTAHISENPGVSHKCGHDGHCAALCGLALELDQLETEKTIYLIFQPAEETGAGGQRCAELLREKNINEVYAFHNLGGFPEGALVYRRGLTQPASEGIEFVFKGKASHASEPENGLNPAEAIAATVLYADRIAGTEEAHPPQGMKLVTVTGVQVGNGDFGISPGGGSLRLTLRAEQEKEMKSLEAQISSFAVEQAKRAGLNLAKNIYDYFPETRNHDAGLTRVLAAAHSLGIPTVQMPELWRASEDFGWYLKECPGAMVYLGNGEDWPALHTSEYDFNDRILETAIELFLRLCVMQETDK